MHQLAVLTIFANLILAFEAKLTPPKPDETKICAEQLINKNLIQKNVTLYLHLNDNIQGLNFEKLTVAYTTLNNLNDINSYLNNKFRRTNAYVLVLPENNLNLIFKKLRTMLEWHSYVRFIIIYEGQNFGVLLKILAEHYVYNVVIINNLNIYTYNPYKYENYLQPDLTPELLTQCGDYDQEFFPEKIPNTWKNSTLRIAWVTTTPFIISTESRTGLEVGHGGWGIYTGNGSYRAGALVDVFNRDADVGLGHFHIRDEHHLMDFETTFSYMDDGVVWAVPRADPRSLFDNIINIFNPILWLCVFVTVIISALIWNQMFHSSHFDYFKASNNFVTIFYTYEILLGLPVMKNLTSVPMRLIYTSIFIFTFIVVTVWKSYLLDSLTHESSGFQISNTEELVDSNLEFAIYKELTEMYEGEGTRIGTEIGRRSIRDKCDASRSCMDDVAYKRKTATMATVRMYEYRIPQHYRTPGGRDMIYVFKDRVLTDYTVQMYQKGHPAFPRINDFLMWFKSSGFSEMLDSNFKHELSLQYQKFMASMSAFETTNLGMKEMEGTFYILCGGWVISILVFVVEVCSVKYAKKISIRMKNNGWMK